MIPRVSNNSVYNNVLKNIQKQLIEQDRLFEQISSNKKIQKPSDNPIGTSESMTIRDALSRDSEYQNTINTGEIWTNITSTALDSATQTWQRVNEIAISAADGTKSNTDLQGMAEELDQLLNLFIQTSNTDNAGLFIFGGAYTTEPPFQAEINDETGRIQQVNFQGNSFLRNVKTSDYGQVPLNVLGANAGNPNVKGTFIDTNAGVNAFDTIIDLRDRLLQNDIIGISGQNGILDEISNVANSLTTAQVQLGGTQQVLEIDRNRILDQNTTLNSALAEIEDADIAQAILELNNVQNVYEAALASGGRIMNNTLLNYI